MKKITLHWLNFTILFIIIFLLGVLIGIVVTPRTQQAEKNTIEKAETIPLKTEMLVADQTETPPVRATGEITPPRLIKKVDPVYPEEARQAKIDGVVIIEATTDVYGRVKEAKVLRSIPELDQAALDAVLQWVYEPYLVDGEPRGVVFTVTIAFKLE